jgi:hypothetical protein
VDVSSVQRTFQVVEEVLYREFPVCLVCVSGYDQEAHIDCLPCQNYEAIR